ncbi:TRAP transporter large permease [Gayadomonas joobiniege]|uniref:TRAP transporter large permease n=1 Tax=Gayadomonas joobiniege TaxID=1234606 RepID=UPI00036BD417|nr:TRAP transporter large permease subunit [Gayadomonas joobiniege]
MEWLSLVMFAVVCLVLLTGFPVAFSLAGTALLFAFVSYWAGIFEWAFLHAIPSRIFGVMTNQSLLAVPLFVFMGVTLQKSKLAEELLISISQLFARVNGGLAVAVILVGALLAASTGIVGATVVTMGLISLPAMLKQKYHPALASGSICAVGTLGQIIPPSIALVLLGDVMSNAYAQAQLNQGIFAPDTVSVGDLFVGALIPGGLLILGYLLYVLILARLKPDWMPAAKDIAESNNKFSLIKVIVPPLLLILLVLGSILAGFATPTEAAGIGATGALILAAAKGRLSLHELKQVNLETVKITSMIFMILLGASVFSLVFRGLGGEELIHGLFEQMPGGVVGATLLVMLVLFLLGFILDFIEITFVVVPIVAPVLLMMGLDPIWLGIMIAINLQTSFLTPPFGFALFYLRGVAGKQLQSSQLYQGVLPFIGIQLLMLVILALFPALATWLPEQIYNN